MIPGWIALLVIALVLSVVLTAQWWRYRRVLQERWSESGATVYDQESEL